MPGPVRASAQAPDRRCTRMISRISSPNPNRPIPNRMGPGGSGHLPDGAATGWFRSTGGLPESPWVGTTIVSATRVAVDGAGGGLWLSGTVVPVTRAELLNEPFAFTRTLSVSVADVCGCTVPTFHAPLVGS